MGGGAGREKVADGLRRVSPRVLVVDDDGDLAEMLAKTLRREGAEVTVSGTVAAAIAAIGRLGWDVLICDLGLPDGSGTAVLRDARSRLGRDCKLVVSSGQDPDVVAGAAADTGADAILLKPYGSDDVEVLLRALTPTGT